MPLKEFRTAGSPRSLVAALLHFDVSFMSWVMIGALGPAIASQLALSPGQKGLIVAVPLLAAAIFRVILGQLVDIFPIKRLGIAMLSFVLVPLAVAWQFGDTLGSMLLVGLMLGVAGASFVIALPMASRWYPPKYQGVAMGIAGAGNSGTVIATFCSPRLAAHVGWHAVFGYAMIPVAVVLVAFTLLAKEPPAQATRPPMPLRDPDLWRLCGFYAVTFGSFVGLATFLPIFLTDTYGMTKIEAGTIAALGGLSGSLLRPVGGIVADKIGGTTTLIGVYAFAAVLFGGLAFMPQLATAELLLIITMGALGFGNGAVFQLVGLRFAGRIGSVTGLVGAAGGLGGFFLPTLLGYGKELSGSYGLGLGVLSGIAATAVLAVAISRIQWMRGWAAAAGARV